VSTAANRLARHVLRAPDFVRRLAVSQTKEPVEAWMLRQSRATRDSYIREVLDKGGDERLAEIWMLRQPDAVRESYISQVLEPQLPPKLQPTQR
jgi:DNA-binding TFAR19-related protein (PDSD5 family)